MNIDAIQGLAPLTASPAFTPLQGLVQTKVSESWTPSDFGSLLAQGLNKVNGDLLTEQHHLQQLALGEGANLHQIMMGLEESRISFQFLMQVRSRFLEAYQDISKMQI